MSQLNKSLPQTYDEMVKTAKETKSSNIYRAESLAITDSRISEAVSRMNESLEDVRIDEKVDLRDSERIKTRCSLYLEACSSASAIPTIEGFAHSLGMTRQALYKFMKNNPSHPTTEWITMMQESFASLLEESSLRGDINNITAIFLLKAKHGYRESVEVIGKTEIPEVEDTPDNLVKEASFLPFDDESGDDAGTLPFTDEE